MIWIIFALISATASAAQNIFHRKIMMTEDPYAYAFLENLLTGLLFIPAAVLVWRMPTEMVAWMLVLASSALWTAIAIISMHSYKFTKVSLRAPVSETRTLWLLLFSVLILGEVVTLQKILGVVIIFGGIVFLNYKPGTKLGNFSDRGVQLTLISALISALVAIVDKKATEYFDAGMYGMLVYLIPAIFIGSYVLIAKPKDVKNIITTKLSWLSVVVVCGFLFYFFQLKALKLAEVSMVYPILRMSTLFTVLGGIFFLGERENIAKKLIATIIVIIGVLLVSGYYTF